MFSVSLHSLFGIPMQIMVITTVLMTGAQIFAEVSEVSSPNITSPLFNFLDTNLTLELNSTKKCDGSRGSCTCDCSWTKTKGACDHDDKSCCWDCCCKKHPTPGPTPGPSPPSPPPSPPAPGLTLYCLSKDDLSKEYGNADVKDGGWSIHGGGRVRSKASFNLLGGYVEWDYDAHDAKVGVNNNLYVTAPDHKKFPKYCDIQETPGCLEMDFVEANGNCVVQTTWHTENGHVGHGNCGKGGCEGEKKIPDSGKFHVKASFSSDGTMKVEMDGDEVKVEHPKPDSDAKKYVKDTLEKDGVMIHSSQWKGWVPGGYGCHGDGSLEDSKFEISNLKVYGRVVQGDTPHHC